MPDGCWYDLVQKGLAGRAEDVEFTLGAETEDGWTGPGLRLEKPQSAAPEEEPEPARLEVEPAPLPDWAAEPVAPSPRPQRPVAPSRLAEPEPAPQLPLGAEVGVALRRGRLVHRLLELLPEVEAAERRAAAERLARRPTWGLDEPALKEAVDGTLDLIANADFAALFGPNSRAEVPLAGMLTGRDGPQLLSGQVDRLVVTDAAVMVVDYKTNRQPPKSDSDIPMAYLRQMAAYRALLQEIYPDRKIACYLLWTEALHLVKLAPEVLCDHAP